MTTPALSATSQSPPMACLPHASMLPSQSSPSTSSNVAEKDNNKTAVEKFMAKAEMSSISRGLRTRLSYASYKASHNASKASIHDLEATIPPSRAYLAKRKAPGSNNYYDNPATQGSGTPLRRGHSASMPPPQILTPRSHYPPTAGEPSSSRHPTQTLFTSILAPPPAKQARTILNAGDPPIPAPVRPAPSPKEVRGNSRAEKSRASHSHRAPRSPDKRGKAKRAGEKRKRGEEEGDMDMKAAATLTSLLLHNHRGSVSSPRSSVDSSADPGSQQQQQYTARTIAPPPPPSSATSVSTERSFRGHTPPMDSGTPQARPAPTDNEAADLMLFLATSPSPARNNSNKEARDMAAFRALGGAGSAESLRAKGRVLFPGAGEDRGPSYPVSAALSRGESSFNSSISSIGSDMNPTRRGSISGGGGPPPPVHRTLTPQSAQLLPPPPLPASSLPSSPSGLRRERSLASAKATPPEELHFDYGNPYHSRPPPMSLPYVGPPPQKMNLGLRADVGRKLFEEEQIRLGMNFGGPPHQQHQQAHQQQPQPQQRSFRRSSEDLGSGFDYLKG